MKKIIYSIICILSLQMILSSCKEDEYTLGDPPVAEDADFSYTISTESDNIINLTSSSGAFLKKWDFGNGETAEGNNVQVTYPFQGTYEITLTVYTSGGSATSKKTIEIEETDLSLLRPVYSLLTGGNSKTWVIAKDVTGHMGIGPSTGNAPIWWAAPPNDKSDVGLYDDKYTFVLNGLHFDHETNGDIYVNGGHRANFPTAYQNKGDYTVPNYFAPDNLRWSVVTIDGKDYINISGNGFIGFYCGTSRFEILRITENELDLKYIDGGTPANAWFHKLVREGYEGSGEPEPETSTLPLDFEGTVPPFNGFGGSTYAVVSNPHVGGVNTSDKVAQYTKGLEGNWAGIETTLATTLDFSTNTTIKMKVYSPVTGRALFKVEEVGNSGNNKEVFADITQANQWQTLTFDFSGTTSDVFNKIALFMDYDNNIGGTFYLDDIIQTAPGCDDADTESNNATTGLNLTMASIGFGEFGGLHSAIEENPFKTGINTSCYVNTYVKNNGCESWSGVGLLLPTAIDFATTTKKKFKLKIYAVNQVSEVTLRLERLAHPDVDPAKERTAMITATGEWQELTFDFSDVTDPLTFKNVLVYFERGTVCDGDTYYFDDLIQFQ